MNEFRNYKIKLGLVAKFLWNSSLLTEREYLSLKGASYVELFDYINYHTTITMSSIHLIKSKKITSDIEVFLNGKFELNKIKYKTIW